MAEPAQSVMSAPLRGKDFMCIECGALKSCHRNQDWCCKCQEARQAKMDELEHARRTRLYVEAEERKAKGMPDPYTRPIKFGRCRS